MTIPIRCSRSGLQDLKGCGPPHRVQRNGKRSLGISENRAAGSGAEIAQNQEKDKEFKPHRFSVAPMMDWTDRHCRFFHRLLSRRALLYTEMVTTGAVIHGDRGAAARLLARRSSRWRSSSAAPSPSELAEAARIAEDFGYDEINLNVGCPSDRVQYGRFGACLMREPAAGRRLRRGDEGGGARAGHGEVPHRRRRPGSRGRRSMRWPTRSVAAGADALIVHARKAWLAGPVAARRTATCRRSTMTASTG